MLFEVLERRYYFVYIRYGANELQNLVFWLKKNKKIGLGDIYVLWIMHAI